jgi:hypothetical protein
MADEQQSTSGPSGETVSELQARTFIALEQTGEWISNAELVQKTGARPRTVTQTTALFVALGIAERLDVHPAPRFRLRSDIRRSPYARRLRDTATVLGLRHGE